MTYPCGNDEYCGDQICDCGMKETKEKLAYQTVQNQMEYFQKRWGYLPEIEKKAQELEQTAVEEGRKLRCSTNIKKGPVRAPR